ncbi:major facilitator superfamily protein [Escherichia coli]|uniref:Major facilitator superfamily protein n=1 Tax=Escherichia coli TaxID=562 RepID=A0A447XFJ7_ECOLX|nr:major facilitator superfamily protein [Escherichia coli]
MNLSYDALPAPFLPRRCYYHRTRRYAAVYDHLLESPVRLSVDLIGYAMTIALTIGVVFSLGFGILADKFDKKRICYWQLPPSPAVLLPFFSE